MAGEDLQQNTINVDGSVRSGSPDSGEPIKVGGRYNLTPPTFEDGARADLQVDENGNLRVAVDGGIGGGGGGGTQYVEGDASSPASGTLMLARYQETPPSLTDGQMYEPQIDNAGNLKVSGAIFVSNTNVFAREVVFDGGPTSGAGMIAAISTLNYDSTPPIDGDYVVIGSQTYTFRVIPIVQYDVSIAFGDGPIINLMAVIAGSSSPGAETDLSATANPDVQITAYDASHLDFRAIPLGAAGNAVVTTSTAAGLTFTDTTLIGGQDGNAIPIFTSVGDNLVIVVGVVTGDGTENDAAAYLKVRSSNGTELSGTGNITNMIIGEIFDTSGFNGLTYLPSTTPSRFVTDGQNIELFVAEGNCTMGSIKFYCFYRPLTEGATIIDEQLSS